MKIALVLGSGGARGYAHIGVISELERRGHQVVGISGTSMGALIGGLYAAGKLDTFETWARALTQRAVLMLLDPSLTQPGIIKADRVVGEVAKMLDGALIEDLPIPFTAVASDITNQREVWFQRGPVDMAIRASIAIPNVITPVMLNGRILVDGGILNPVPLEPLASVVSDVTVAVTLSGRPALSGLALALSNSSADAEEPDSERPGRSSIFDNELVRGILSRFGRSPAPDSDDAAPPPATVAHQGFETLPSQIRTMDVANRSLETMQHMIERYRMAANPPNVLVTVPRDTCSTYDFHRATDVIEVGRTLAAEAFDKAGL